MLTKLDTKYYSGEHIEINRKQVSATLRVVIWDYIGRAMLSKIYDGESLRELYFSGIFLDF